MKKKQKCYIYTRVSTAVQVDGCPFHPDRHPSMKLNDDYYYTI